MMVEPDVDYPISFGDTMQGMPAEYCTLRYRDDFKPVHACRSGTAAFQLDGVQASLSLPNSKASQGHVQFEGTLEHGKDGVDCVLVFEGGACRLEALAGHINNLRHVRTAAQPASQLATATDTAFASSDEPPCDERERADLFRQASPEVAVPAAEGSSGAGGCTSSTTSSSSSSSSSSDSDSESDSGGHRDGTVSSAAAHPGAAVPSPAQMALNNQELQFLGWDGAEEI